MNYKCTGCGWTGDKVFLTRREVDWDNNLKYCCPNCTALIDVINYSRTPPTEPGWCWYRISKGLEAEMVRVLEFTDAVGNKIWQVRTTEPINNFFDLERFKGEWSDRVVPPE